MRVLDSILFALLLVGNLLGLPVWWWLFWIPASELWRRGCAAIHALPSLRPREQEKRP